MSSTARTKKKQTDILNAASELFLERGYDAVSLDEILERVGGSKTTFYSYYGGKEGLFAVIVEKICQEKVGPLLALDVANQDPKTALNAFGRQLLALLSDPGGCALFRCMISEAQRFPKLASTFFANGPEGAIRLLKHHIEQWQRKQVLRSGNAEVLAIQFMGLMMGNFHLKSLLGLMEPMSEKQNKAWVARGVDLFLEGASLRRE